MSLECNPDTTTVLLQSRAENVPPEQLQSIPVAQTPENACAQVLKQSGQSVPLEGSAYAEVGGDTVKFYKNFLLVTTRAMPNLATCSDFSIIARRMWAEVKEDCDFTVRSAEVCFAIPVGPNTVTSDDGNHIDVFRGTEELFADDYDFRPFSCDELGRRVAVAAGEASAILEGAALVINEIGRIVEKENEKAAKEPPSNPVLLAMSTVVNDYEMDDPVDDDDPDSERGGFGGEEETEDNIEVNAYKQLCRGRTDMVARLLDEFSHNKNRHEIEILLNTEISGWFEKATKIW